LDGHLHWWPRQRETVSCLGHPTAIPTTTFSAQIGIINLEEIWQRLTVITLLHYMRLRAKQNVFLLNRKNSYPSPCLNMGQIWDNSKRNIYITLKHFEYFWDTLGTVKMKKQEKQPKIQN